MTLLTKCDRRCYKMQQLFNLLQNATVLLQNATVIKKCVDFITKCDCYYTMQCLLQNVTACDIINDLRVILFHLYITVIDLKL